MNEVKRIVISTIKGVSLCVLLTMIGIALVNISNKYYIYNNYSFKLIGNTEVTILKGEEYEDLGVRILSQEGINLSNYVTKKNDVNINEIGTYEIKYKSKYNNIEKLLVRKVNVIEKESVNKWISIPSYEGSGEVTHPKVLYFENGYNGYKYWMVNTPYPKNDAYYENPSIVVSNNGIDWIQPKGIKNPVSGYTSSYRVEIVDTGELKIIPYECVKSGYLFIGWVDQSGIKYSRGDMYIVNSDFIFTAQYVSLKESYTSNHICDHVSWDNGGNVNIIDEGNKYYDYFNVDNAKILKEYGYTKAKITITVPIGLNSASMWYRWYFWVDIDGVKKIEKKGYEGYQNVTVTLTVDIDVLDGFTSDGTYDIKIRYGMGGSSGNFWNLGKTTIEVTYTK